MALLLCLQALVACKALAAPANSTQTLIPVTDLTEIATNTSSSSQFSLYTNISSTASVTSTIFPSPLSDTGTLFSQTAVTVLSSIWNTAPASSQLSFISSSLSLSPTQTTPYSTFTTFVTDVVTAFETTTVDATEASTTIVTEIVTVTVTATTTPTTTSSPSWDGRTLWAAPPRITDLFTFNITYFPSGQQNLDIVAEIPSEAIAPSAKFVQEPPLPSSNTTDPSTFLQLLYPANSVNPGSKPAGGASFYASPLNLAGARNVTLAYSVFFPADFDWVKGGKLPGLFGGHTGCSGGASAQDCFSTRLMWRPGGVGELYLYAPKDKQTDALCADVNSVCDAVYGFSVGRGAFNFSAGDWTHLAQNVVLNTPGRNDGEFALVVDGQKMIERADVFYRDAVQQPVEFLGLFFSTFFGGHGKKYATPKEQYTWFKDFVITRHD